MDNQGRIILYKILTALDHDISSELPSSPLGSPGQNTARMYNSSQQNQQNQQNHYNNQIPPFYQNNQMNMPNGNFQQFSTICF